MPQRQGGKAGEQQLHSFLKKKLLKLLHSEKILPQQWCCACPRSKWPAGTPSEKSPPLWCLSITWKKKSPSALSFLKELLGWIILWRQELRLPGEWLPEHDCFRKFLSNLSFKAPPFPPKQLFILIGFHSSELRDMLWLVLLTFCQ